jgi:hypothetical protein
MVTFPEWLEVSDLLLFSLGEIVLHESPSGERNTHCLETFIQLTLVSQCFYLQAAAILTYVAPNLRAKSFIIHQMVDMQDGVLRGLG